MYIIKPETVSMFGASLLITSRAIYIVAKSTGCDSGSSSRRSSSQGSRGDGGRAGEGLFKSGKVARGSMK